MRKKLNWEWELETHKNSLGAYVHCINVASGTLNLSKTLFISIWNQSYHQMQATFLKAVRLDYISAILFFHAYFPSAGCLCPITRVIALLRLSARELQFYRSTGGFPLWEENGKFDMFIKRHISVWTLSFCHCLTGQRFETRRPKTVSFCVPYTEVYACSLYLLSELTDWLLLSAGALIL